MPLQDPDLRAIKAAAKSEFGHIPGITGFGIGARSLRIYVQDADVSKQLPTEYRGVPIDIIVTGEITGSGAVPGSAIPGR